MNLRHPTFHYSLALERLSVPSPYAGSNFASLCAAYAVLVTALTNTNTCTLSWWAVILIVLGMLLTASMLSYWQSGRILQNQFANAIDIERRLSTEIREQGKSDPSALPDDNLAGILYRVNVLKSDLRTLGPMRRISKGYRTVEASLDRVSSSIQSAGTFVFDDAFRPESELKQCTDELIKVLREIRDILKRKK